MNMELANLFSGQSAGKSKCSGSNEVYIDCGPSCQTECSTLGEPCMIAHIRCPDGCYCLDGYARDGAGRCIPTDDCPSKEI